MASDSRNDAWVRSKLPVQPITLAPVTGTSRPPETPRAQDEHPPSFMRSFLHFGLLSGGGWLLDCTLLLLLSQGLGVNISLANVVSSITAALAVFTVSRLRIFNPAANRPLLRTVAYALYTLCVIAAASALLGFLVDWLELGARYLALAPSAGQISFVAKVLVTPPQLLANFFMSRYLSQRSI